LSVCSRAKHLFFISFKIFHVNTWGKVCVCERERERKSVCVCVCV
jgi:hypothetical protein